MRLCQFFGCGGKSFSKWEHISTKKSYWVTSLWFASRCVYFIRPDTLLLCIFLFCIFLLYRTDSQVQVQIRILLKDKYRKSSQKCKHWQSHFDFLKNAYPVSVFLRNNSRAKISFCYCVSLSCFVWIYNHTVTIVTQKYRELCLISETILIGFFILDKKLANIPPIFNLY